jgi:hypothetical protein
MRRDRVEGAGGGGRERRKEKRKKRKLPRCESLMALTSIVTPVHRLWVQFTERG